jgi:HAD superfamily hydrolase (TIGR01459 family)
MPTDASPEGSSDTVPLLPGVSALAERYDGFVLDVWGVIHDGQRLYDGVGDALDRLEAAGKRYVMLTNAPRRARAVTEMLTGMGMPARHAARVWSSGESVWQALATRSDPWHAALGRRCYHMGAPHDRGLFEGLDLDIEPAVEEADFILNTGPWRIGSTVDEFEPVLATGARLGLPMVCANPDLRVMRGEAEVICAGALAERYEVLGGAVCYHGKPHADIYAECLARLGGLARARIVAIGDTLVTDVAGARSAGIDSVFVLEGIHAGEVRSEAPADLAAFFAERGIAPCYALRRFAW